MLLWHLHSLHLALKPTPTTDRSLLYSVFVAIVLFFVPCNLHARVFEENSLLQSTSSESSDLLLVTVWILKTADNHQRPFIVLDKKSARIFVYDPQGIPLGDAPVLLGLAIGDFLPPGISSKPLSQIPPEDRITQAGRYYARRGKDSNGKEVLWVDYDSALAIHPVVTGNVQQRRMERLQSPTIADNRISWGCINVLADFYIKVISPAFARNGFVYILPETMPVSEFFGIGKGKTVPPALQLLQ